MPVVWPTKVWELITRFLNVKSCLGISGTLAKYHPWIIRKSASVAMYAMPTREKLLNHVCACPIEAVQTLPAMLDATDTVYDRVEALYTKYDLHGLP